MENRFALVLGSSSGIGYAVSSYLLDEGYTVFGASRSGTDIMHERFIDILSDVRDEESVVEMYEIIAELADSLHLVVNSAGICNMTSIDEMDSEEFNDHFATNVLGAFHIIKYFRPFIVDNLSHFIHISSTASKHSASAGAAYSSSQHALNALIDCSRRELKKSGVRFSTLIPGAVNTPFWDKISTDVSRENMLDIDDFFHVFEMVVNSPPMIHFPELVFSHMFDGPY